jgi:hypothetical protein
MTASDPNARTERFAARRDAWLVGVLSVVTLSMIWLLARLMGSDATLVAKMLLGPVLLAAAAFSLWCLFGTRYQLGPDALLVRVGPFRWRIRLESIVEIHPDRNLLSSAALSYARLRIRVSGGPGDIYVSPRNRQRFLDCMQAACPGLRRDGERLVQDIDVQRPTGTEPPQ